MSRQEVGGRGADEQDGGVRDRARLDADDEGIACDVVAERADQVAGRHAQKDRRDREQQERESDGSRSRQERREEPPHFVFFGSPNPAFASNARPRFETTCFTKARAADRCALVLTTASS